MPSLSITDIQYAYGKHKVLHNVSASPIQAGSLVGLIGPNAAGKSTLFKCITGLCPISAGSIYLGEQNLDELPLKQRLSRVCYMPQFFVANAALSVFEVVLMAHKQLKGWTVSDADKLAVAQALEYAGIGHLSETNIADLSGGQSQMVSLCQALVRQADLYLFDEPTSALDLRHQLQGLSKIRQAIKEKNAIGMVALHDLNLAAKFTDHLLLLDKGQLLAEGTPQSVLCSPMIEQIYGVNIEILTTKENELHVSASL